jgi:hypothetical protein
LLHHDNAPAHTAFSAQRFLAAKNVAVVPHPPYSPDLAPCDFFLFPRMKSKLKGRRFQDVTDIQEQSLTDLHAIPKSQFQRCFQQWQKRWTRCINGRGQQQVMPMVSVYFVIDSVRKLLDTPSYWACHDSIFFFFFAIAYCGMN